MNNNILLLQQQLDQQRRSLRRMKTGLGAIVLMASILGLYSFREKPVSQDIIRAKGIVIVDDFGKERILIGAPIPFAKSRVWNDTARVREKWASRYPNPDQYMAYYRGYNKNANGMVIMDDNGFDRIVIGDPVSDPNIGKRIGPSTGMVINDEAGNERSGYGLLNVNGRKRVVLGLDAETGYESIALSVLDNGKAGLTVYGPQKHTAFLGIRPKDSTQDMFNGLVIKKGKK